MDLRALSKPESEKKRRYPTGCFQMDLPSSGGTAVFFTIVAERGGG